MTSKLIYWPASPYNGSSGRHLGFDSSFWKWGNNARSGGFPVRAVAKE